MHQPPTSMLFYPLNIHAPYPNPPMQNHTFTFTLTVIQQPVSIEEYNGLSLALLPFSEHKISIFYDHDDPMVLRWRSGVDDGIQFARRVGKILKNEMAVE